MRETKNNSLYDLIDPNDDLIDPNYFDLDYEYIPPTKSDLAFFEARGRYPEEHEESEARQIALGNRFIPTPSPDCGDDEIIGYPGGIKGELKRLGAGAHETKDYAKEDRRRRDVNAVTRIKSLRRDLTKIKQWLDQGKISKDRVCEFAGIARQNFNRNLQGLDERLTSAQGSRKHRAEALKVQIELSDRLDHNGCLNRISRGAEEARPTEKKEMQRPWLYSFARAFLDQNEGREIDLVLAGEFRELLPEGVYYKDETADCPSSCWMALQEVSMGLVPSLTPHDSRRVTYASGGELHEEQITAGMVRSINDGDLDPLAVLTGLEDRAEDEQAAKAKAKAEAEAESLRVARLDAIWEHYAETAPADSAVRWKERMREVAAGGKLDKKNLKKFTEIVQVAIVELHRRGHPLFADPIHIELLKA